MKKLTLCLGLPLLIAGCATSDSRHTAEAEQVTLFEKDARDVVIHSGFGSSRIESWRVVDDSTMIIETFGHGEVVATFSMPCRGIRTADTLGFATMGPFDLDKTTKVILPDGRKCYFKELKPLVKLEDSEGDDN